ncbi:MAG: hypothetical protein ABJG47_05240 [Ekhidna sp.]
MKRLLVGLLTILTCFTAYSQKDNYTEGYIITNDSKVVFADLAYRTEDKTHFSCVVKSKNGRIREYFPQELKGYGYLGGNLYNSVQEDSIFAKVLIKGSLSLWKYKNSFYLHYADELYNLRKEGVESARNVFESCLESSEVDKSLKMKEPALQELVISFNDCKKEEYTLFAKKKANLQLEYGITTGISQSSLKFSENSSFEYLSQNYQSADPFYGLSINVSMPKAVEGLSFQQEIQFSNSSYFDLVVVENLNETNFYDTYIDLKSLSLPFSVKYAPVEVSGLHPYFQIGINYRKLKSNTIVQTEVVDGNVVTTEPETEAFKVKDKTIGTWFGVGISKEFQSLKGDVFVRYYSNTEVSNSNRLSAENSQLTFGVLISYLQAFRK